jgi:uncharacterized membrane protein
MSFDDLAHHVGRAFELVAMLVLAAALVLAVVGAATSWRATHDPQQAFRTARRLLGGGLLIAVEVLVAADLVGTVAVDPTVENVAVLGGIVLIRTFLSFSIETEIEGVVPWRRERRG